MSYECSRLRTLRSQVRVFGKLSETRRCYLLLFVVSVFGAPAWCRLRFTMGRSSSDATSVWRGLTGRWRVSCARRSSSGPAFSPVPLVSPPGALPGCAIIGGSSGHASGPTGRVIGGSARACVAAKRLGSAVSSAGTPASGGEYSLFLLGLVVLP